MRGVCAVTKSIPVYSSRAAAVAQRQPCIKIFSVVSVITVYVCG